MGNFIEHLRASILPGADALSVTLERGTPLTFCRMGFPVGVGVGEGDILHYPNVNARPARQYSETDGDNLRCTPTCFSPLLIERLGSSTADHLLNFKADVGTMRRAACVVGVLRRAENGCLTLRHDKDRQCALKVDRGLR